VISEAELDFLADRPQDDALATQPSISSPVPSLPTHSITVADKITESKFMLTGPTNSEPITKPELAHMGQADSIAITNPVLSCIGPTNTIKTAEPKLMHVGPRPRPTTPIAITEPECTHMGPTAELECAHMGPTTELELTHTGRRWKHKDISGLSQCLCGESVLLGDVGSIQCQRAGCETVWVSNPSLLPFGTSQADYI
jgi:hypothetical protein